MGNFYAKVCLIPLFLIGGSQILGSRVCAQTQSVPAQMPGQISAKEATTLEALLDGNPENLDAQERLLRYYFVEMTVSRRPDIEGKREKNILWLIEHHPESDLAGSPEASIMPDGPLGSIDGYYHGKQLWLQEADKHPDNQRILRHAAAFFLVSEGKIARELLEKAWALDSSDAETSAALAQAYEFERRDASSPEERATLAKKVYSIRKQALERTDGLERFSQLGDVANSALEAGEPEQAKLYATELLKSAQKFNNNWNYGDAMHHGNSILGRIALSRGDIVGAKQYLLAAAQIPGSPALDSFGPNMTLAKELLEKGESETVLAYLQSCGKFWKMGGDKLQAWTATIKGGGIPDFEANLDY